MGDKSYTCRVKKWGVCVYSVSDSLTAYVICFGRAWSRFKPWGPIELCGLAGAARLLNYFYSLLLFFMVMVINVRLSGAGKGHVSV